METIVKFKFKILPGDRNWSVDYSQIHEGEAVLDIPINNFFELTHEYHVKGLPRSMWHQHNCYLKIVCSANNLYEFSVSMIDIKSPKEEAFVFDGEPIEIELLSFYLNGKDYEIKPKTNVWIGMSKP